MSITIRNEIKIPQTIELFKLGSVRAVRISAEVLLQISKNHVPHDKGILENSGSVDFTKDGPTASVFYDTPYAERLHEDPDINFKGKGRHKWLEDAAKTNQKVLLKAMQQAMREALK